MIPLSVLAGNQRKSLESRSLMRPEVGKGTPVRAVGKRNPEKPVGKRDRERAVGKGRRRGVVDNG